MPNHAPGSDDDIGNLRLSNEVRNWIADRIRDGLNVKDHIVTRDDIYNICKEVIKEYQIKHSIEEQNLTCAIPQPEGNSEHDIGKLFGFTIPTGKEIIYEVSEILLDTTHNTNKHKDLLYTFLLPDPKTGKRITIAHLLSPKAEFYFVGAWRENLNKACKDRAKAIEIKLNPNEKKLLRDELFADLKYLMNINDINLAMADELEEHGNIHGKINRRSDLLMYELCVIMNGDTQQQRRLADVRAGQMMLAEKEVRRRQLEAHSLVDTVIEVGNGDRCWTVASETDHDTRYSELHRNIQEITRNLDDLDIGRLQIVHSQLSRVLGEVCRIEGDFQVGNWESEGQRINPPLNLNFERQQR
ncbi:40829_t:CDS:2 [Gigaspora margarita]|uniref:40829_t:CDS:1 n=1 Tax=Gigaspora margarita TaxID=4874 RepID=A0ABN7V8I4_GIGMA|nr:40829_t:CDS:2 [Gigaspora margarita]